VNRRAELVVLALLLGATLAAVGFIAAYAIDSLPAQTQLMGLALGFAFAFLAAASVVTAKALVPEDDHAEDYPEPPRPERAVEVDELVRGGTVVFTRRRLLGLAAGGAAVTLGAALVVPAASLGPFLETDRLRRSPWRRGIRLVDSEGRPLLARDVDFRSFHTAFPEGSDHEKLGSPLIVVRLEPAQLELPAGREGWAPDGIVAYSKICTHAGCAVSMYRAPLYEPTSDRPALVCPCHYSTFDPARGAKVLFGPAGRPLPQLPLEIDSSGHLRAAGGFSGAIGPSWSGVRYR
jgi:ubiquinol-cytochrome c reductase iron-sulfur subunit